MKPTAPNDPMRCAYHGLNAEFGCVLCANATANRAAGIDSFGGIDDAHGHLLAQAVAKARREAFEEAAQLAVWFRDEAPEDMKPSHHVGWVEAHESIAATLRRLAEEGL